MYSEITALSTKDGYCFAENDYFADLYGKEVNTISYWVSKLVRAGFIRREIDKSKGNRRKLYVNNLCTPIPKKQDRYTEKTGVPYPEKSGVIYKSNTTRFNNKNNKAFSVDKQKLIQKMTLQN